MKIYDILRYYPKLLKNSTTPNLDVEILLSYVLGHSRTSLLLNIDLKIEEHQEKHFKSLIDERINGKPIAYITKTKNFWKSSFIVSESTLIPRPDTETIIEAFKCIYKNTNTHLRVLDLGSGTGCIIISLMNEYKNSIGIGIEKSQKAFFITKKNIANNNLHNRTKIFMNDWNNTITPIYVDVIVSNPPYIKGSEIKNLPKDISKYEPKIALDGGITGLKSYIEIFRLATRCLKNNGLILLEIGSLQYKHIYSIGIKNGFKHYGTFNDLSGIKRVIVFKKKKIHNKTKYYTIAKIEA